MGIDTMGNCFRCILMVLHYFKHIKVYVYYWSVLLNAYCEITCSLSLLFIHRDTQKHLAIVLSMKNNFWKCVLFVVRVLKLLLLLFLGLLLGVHKFYRSYTGLHKRSEIHFPIMTEISEYKHSIVLCV